MPWMINWDNGVNACGTFPYRFATEREAADYAESLTFDMITEDVWSEDGLAEPTWVDDEPICIDSESIAEQSLDYFDRFIAGDR